MKAYSVLGLLFIFVVLHFTLAFNVYPQTLKKIYIFRIKVSGTQDKTLEKKIRNTLILNIINNFKDKYSILDEDSLFEISQKLKKLQQLGCNDEICFQEISNAIDADEFISGEVIIERENYKVEFRNTSKNKESFEMSIKSLVSESFYAFQLEYFLEEIAKKLLNPNYIINKKNAPIKFSSDFKISENNWKEFEKLPPITANTTRDRKLTILIDTLKAYLVQADMSFSAKHYEKSLQSYKNILNTISETTRNEEKEQLTEFILLVRERIRINQNIILANELNRLDEFFKQANEENQEEILQEYISLLGRYAKLEYYEKNPTLEQAICERIISIYEKKGENYYKSFEFSKSYHAYQKSLEYVNLPSLQKRKQQIQSNLNTVIKSGINYIESIIKSNCDEAEILNTKYEIEYKNLNSNEARNYKYQAISIMEKTAELIEKEKMFLTLDVIQYYDHTARNVNRDSGEFLVTVQNIVLFPFRYIGNLAKGISDIFVFKFGVGLGGGAELGPVGAGGVYGYFPMEFSTAYPYERAKLQENSSDKISLEDKNVYFGLGYVYGGNCFNFIGLRLCEDFKKYTTGNFWIGLGPSMYIGLELHRVPEYFGVIFFQDWNLMGFSTERFHYFSYKKIPKLYSKVGIKSQPSFVPSTLWSNRYGIQIDKKIITQELLKGQRVYAFINEKEGFFLKSSPDFNSDSIIYLPYNTEVLLLQIATQGFFSISNKEWLKIRVRGYLEGWVPVKVLRLK